MDTDTLILFAVSALPIWFVIDLVYLQPRQARRDAREKMKSDQKEALK